MQRTRLPTPVNLRADHPSAIQVALRWSVVAVIASCLQGCSHSGNTPAQPAPPAQVFDSLDGFYQELARRVTEQMGGQTQDFSVIPTPGAWNVGTVLRQAPMVPVSFGACRPPDKDPEVQPTDAPTLFPSYSVSRNVGASIGLDDSVLNGVASIDAGASQNTVIGLSISHTALMLWSDNGLKAMLESPTCRAALVPGTTYRLVRGLILGTRNFRFGVTQAAHAGAKVAHVANFDVQLSGDGSQITVSDEKDEGFLAVISEFTASASGTVAAVSKPQAPQAGSTTGSIYIQQSAADPSQNAQAIAQSLQAAQLPTASGIEKIPEDKMPRTAEVRYFNSADEGKARETLETVRRSYPKAKLVALPLPAPAGQIEVWLPKPNPPTNLQVQ